MAVNLENIEKLAAPAIEKSATNFKDLFLGLTQDAGQAFIKKELSERSPPVNRQLNNQDTAKGEQRANLNQFLTPKNIAIGATTILALGVLAFVVLKAVK